MSRVRSDSGYSLVELLVSSAIMLTVTGAIFSMMNPSRGIAQTQPEVADLQQRIRVGSDVLFKDLVIAGAGPYQGPVTGSLVNFFAPVIPHKMGLNQPPPCNLFCTDAITLSYIPNSYSQTTISQAMPKASAELKVKKLANCPPGDDLCGFKEGMEVIIFDTSGNWDLLTITQVQDNAGHLQHRWQDLSVPYDAGASIMQIQSSTIYMDRTTHQLKRSEGLTESTLADNVVDLRFDYFGDPNPPKRPKPPAGVANCLYDASGNYVNLPVLSTSDGSLAPLPGDMLSDGPFCGAGLSQFDADLLRIRKVRVSIRMQASSAGLRGKDPTIWVNPGTSQNSTGLVPDYAVTFDVAPRNLNLAR